MPSAAIVRPLAHTTDTRLTLLRDLYSELRTTLQRVVRDPSAVAVHNARVASRHLRALLRSLRNEANPARYAQLRFDLTNLGREFAEVRSADAQLRLVGALLIDNSRVNTKDRTILTTLLERRTTSTRRSLIRRIQSDAWQQRLSRVTNLVNDDELLLIPPRAANKELATILLTSVDETISTTDKRRNSIFGLHKQRIRIKSARYVCESISPLIKLDSRRAIAALGKAQDLLGELHDRCGLIEWLKSAPIPPPLLKQLLKGANADIATYRKHYRRMRPELRKRLRKLVATVSA